MKDVKVLEVGVERMVLVVMRNRLAMRKVDGRG